ncbi:Cytochrome c, mono-and diheme variants [Poseidonocella pacifica]|uniref:Cytochrome c, mono-and diheme variants n=1 Tax=Poseidonocella pacifica TaxID=871651 RepID=A0A1I0VUH8_9RHOB|nr:cytochrome c [Poseidonocella pacifica]SFA80069.1 Cytochrome c, mono-and diheme variants [Poseidonocella pacifica]
MTRTLLALIGAASTLAACVQPPVISGKTLFLENCSGCHGAAANGEGALAGHLDVAPPDLTRLTARNGGVFPETHVLSTIDGYTRGDHFSREMPEFGAALGGDPVMIETGEGIVTPTPERLVAIAEYLQAIQVQ